MRSKAALRDALVAILQNELDAARQAHLATTSAATHEEAKPENDKDTRALEQSYLARGQAMRVRDLESAVKETAAMPIRAFGEDAPIALGAIVRVLEGEAHITMFVAPHGGGHLVGDVQVVTSKSPLGKALIGKRAGDSADVTVASRTRELEIERVD